MGMKAGLCLADNDFTGSPCGFPQSYPATEMLSALQKIPSVMRSVTPSFCWNVISVLHEKILRRSLDVPYIIIDPWDPGPMGALNKPTASFMYATCKRAERSQRSRSFTLQKACAVAAHLIWRIGCVTNDGR